MTNLFINATNVSSTTTINGSAEIIAIAMEQAQRIMQQLNEDSKSDKLFEKQLIAATTSHIDALALTELFINYNELFVEYDIENRILAIATIDDVKLIIKSQASKKSRLGKQQKNQTIFTNYLSAVIAEQLCKMIVGTNSRGTARNSAALDFDELAVNPDKLSKAIRNIQSKKSIMKSKIGFDENSEAWLELLDAEAQLKELRGTTTATKVEYIPLKVQQAKSLLQDIDDISKLNLKDAKALLTDLQVMLVDSKSNNESNTDLEQETVNE